MLRLAFTFVLLLLMLFGGAVWLLGLEPQLPTVEREAQKQEKPAKQDEAANKQPADDIDALHKALERNPTPSDGSASFDIARIDPEGASVFAGRGEPNSLVTITVDGKEIGTAQVDENGEWTFTTEGRISNPDGKLALFKAPPGSVPRDFAAAEPKAPKKPSASASASAEPSQKTARAVTSDMLKSLEGMVAEARKAEGKTEDRATVPEPAVAPTAPAAAAPSSSAATAPARESTPPPGSASTQKSAVAAFATNLPEASPRASVPVPVTFVYNEATLTGEGRRAAKLLLEYLQIKRFPKITLTGHADERGSDQLNMNLSRDRLETVARFLREGGYGGQLDLVPKGKSEPYTGVVRGDFSQEDLWQLDRRVELLVSR
ncbi:OmpA family protein [Hyphomicrobium sp. 1Nfss2.1]|uniref:OmpA family protein n=1 Tax=Hyphomicrobium sp. 1Nfss2.1 TaxID=3413936 RepID=UPI003C7E257F